MEQWQGVLLQDLGEYRIIPNYRFHPFSSSIFYLVNQNWPYPEVLSKHSPSDQRMWLSYSSTIAHKVGIDFKTESKSQWGTIWPSFAQFIATELRWYIPNSNFTRSVVPPAFLWSSFCLFLIGWLSYCTGKSDIQIGEYFHWIFRFLCNRTKTSPAVTCIWRELQWDPLGLFF